LYNILAMSRFESCGLKHLAKVVQNSNSFADILREFDYAVSSESYRLLKRVLTRNEIDFSHIAQGLNSNLGRKFIAKRVGIETYLVKGSKIDNYRLKKRLIEYGLMLPKCSDCGLGEEWQGRPLTLQLDHINGDRSDNRLENLRILCPNCHTQTETHSGKNKSNTCSVCAKKIGKKSTLCRLCQNTLPKKRKFDIGKSELQKLIWEKPIVDIAIEFGVSDSAIHKRCNKFGLSKPPIGYWLSKQ